jgi:hypothetical protein
MARLTTRQKALRVVDFLLGLRHEGVAAALSQHGFTPEELAEGWQLVAAMTSDAFAEREAAEPVSDVLAALTAWEREWFPITAAALRARHPRLHAAMFDHLGPTEGNAIIFTVGTFLTRLAQLDSTAAGKEARKLLAARGLDARVVAEATSRLASIRALDVPASGSLSEREFADRDAEREAALWSWYLEWSAVARVAIHDKHQLRALGFRPDGSGSATDEPEPEPEAPKPSVDGPAGDVPRAG